MSKFNKKSHRSRKQQVMAIDKTKLSTDIPDMEVDYHNITSRASKYYKKLQSIVGILLKGNR